MGKKFVNDEVSNIEFIRNLNLAAESKNDTTCCAYCTHSNGECIDFAKAGKCIKYNKYHSAMLPSFPIGRVNLKSGYLSIEKENDLWSDFYIIEKLNDNEFGVTFAYSAYDDELGESVVKSECNQDRLYLDELKKSELDCFDYFDSYNEKSTNYLYVTSGDTKFDLLSGGFKSHCDFWMNNEPLEQKSVVYIFNYEDMFKVLLSPNYNLEYAIFI